MERGPLPPHERSWRHPSELAADTRQAIRTERPPSSVRNAALAGGTLTILLVGVVVLSLTPSAIPNPTVAGSTPVDQRITSAAMGAPSTDRTRAGSRSVTATTPGLELGVAGAPLATVLGDGGLAVLPSRTVIALLDGDADRSPASHAPASITVVLHDGSTTAATVLDAGDGVGLAVIRFDHGAVGANGFDVAPDVPGDHETVTVMAAEPIDIEMRRLPGVDLATAAVVDGTAVLDADGNLVGLLTNGDGGGQLLAIDDTIAAGYDTDDDADDDASGDDPDLGAEADDDVNADLAPPAAVDASTQRD